MRRSLVVLIGLLGASCSKPADKSAPENKAGESEKAAESGGADALQSSSTDPRENPVAPPDFGEESLMQVDPNPKVEDKPGTRPHVIGWSVDGEEFGYCTGAGGDTCTECEFFDRAGNLDQVSDCPEGAQVPDPAKTDEIQARVAKSGFSDPGVKWKFGEVTVLWNGHIAEDGGRKQARLRLGGQVDSRVPVYSVNVIEDGYSKIFPEVLSLSPQADRIGVLAHAWDEEGQLETFQIRIIDVRELAAQAYNGAGLLYSHAEKPEESIDHFHKAAHAWPGQKWSMYNLACALAKTGAPGVEAALVAAIEQGGAEVKAKLPTDKDLESVRDKDWFKALAK